jgi:hypothetical protein
MINVEAKKKYITALKSQEHYSTVLQYEEVVDKMCARRRRLNLLYITGSSNTVPQASRATRKIQLEYAAAGVLNSTATGTGSGQLPHALDHWYACPEVGKRTSTGSPSTVSTGSLLLRNVNGIADSTSASSTVKQYTVAT